MKLAQVAVKNFRCLKDVRMDLAELTVLLGANNAGKSTMIKALEFFFDRTELTPDDVYGGTDTEVSVQVTFDDVNDADRASLQKYAQGDRVVLTRTWRNGETKLTGTALRYPPFDPIKAASGREPARLYREMRDDNPDLGLPEATTKDAVEQAMLTWEMDHAEQCEPTPGVDATSFLGFSSVGSGRLDERFRFVFVPGLRDASAEAVERRGTLLSRLLSAVADQRAKANEQLAELEASTRAEYEKVVRDSHGPTLDDLAGKLTQNMRRYVPDADIELLPVAAEISIGSPMVELRGGEAQTLTDLGRQGHGFQRTFIMTVLEYLANTATDGDAPESRPTLFLAIEEPELYQHPPRARHFADTLWALAESGSGVQVCYATHSPYFVSPAKFEKLRIFRRASTDDDDGPPTTAISAATVSDVTARLPENRRDQPQRVLARTLSEAFREAFFSRAVLLVEGPSDAAVLEAVARKSNRSLTALGVVVVSVGKGAIPTALAILSALDIPVFVVFDADSKAQDASGCEVCNRGARSDRTSAAASNRAIMHALGEPEEDFPPQGVRDGWACFTETIEEAVPVLKATAEQIAERYGWGAKSPEAYGEAIDAMDAEDLPSDLQAMIGRALQLAEATRDE